MSGSEHPNVGLSAAEIVSLSRFRMREQSRRTSDLEYIIHQITTHPQTPVARFVRRVKSAIRR